MMGMELWRPDWFNTGTIQSDMRANELVLITRGTLHIAQGLMIEAMNRDFYHTTQMAEREIFHVLNPQKPEIKPA